MKKNKLRRLATGAVIAALYAALTALAASMGLAIGPFEFRFSEALCILPVFTPAAVPGLYVGCIVANVISGGHVLDIVLGSLASLIGAMGTFALRKKPLLALIPPILSNTLIIPPILYYVYGFTDGGYAFLLLTFFVGEAVSAGGFGYLLWRGLKKHETLFL
jgi:uncharacterized membrane protein